MIASPLRFLLVAVAGLAVASGLVAAAAAPTPAELLRAAGEAGSDEARLAHLQELARVSAASGIAIPGLEEAIGLVTKWTSPTRRLNFFKDEVLETLDYRTGVPDDSPLRPIADFYRARMLTWVLLEYSDLYPDPARRAEVLGRARRLFESVRAAYPANRIAGMYLGQPIPPDRELAVPPGAPRWAVAQREGIERLADVIEWWIDHRQRPSGEFGGKWGDDCEMWREWATILIGFEDPRIRAAQSFFSTSLLAQPHLAGGYTDKLTDVEHTAEDTADSLTPMMFLAPEDPAWAVRALRLVDLAETLWTGRNARGQLQFRSTYFTATQVDEAAARACDTVYHPRVLQPALLHWQRTGDARTGRLVSEWMRTWCEAAARAERGKPAGIVPTAIHWPDGGVGGVGATWWRPENYETPLYDFPSAMGLMLNTLTLTAHMTGDDRFMEPLRSMARARREWIEAGRPEAPAGSWLWCGAQLSQLAEPLAKYRLLRGGTEFDGLLAAESSHPYLRHLLSGDLAALEQSLGELATTLRLNFPGFTSEVRFTDRVFRFPILYEAGWMTAEGWPLPGGPIEGGVTAPGLNRLGLLYSTVTGDPGDSLYFPLNAVRWCTAPRDFAALVSRASDAELQARLFHFSSAPRRFDVELLRLAPGRYRWSLAPVAEAPDEGRSGGGLTITGRAGRLPLVLPGGREFVLSIVQEEEPTPAP